MSETFIILAAGEGRKMKNYGPKSLLSYKGKKVIDRQIETIRSLYADASILLVSGFGYKEIKDFNPDCDVIYNPNYNRYNVCHSLKVGLDDSLASNLWIIHGDILFSKTSLKVPDKSKATVFFDKKDRIEPKKVGISHQDEKLLFMNFSFKEKWTQIAFFPQEDYFTVKNIVKSLHDNLLTFEVINKISESIPISTVENRQGSIIEINSMKDLK